MKTFTTEARSADEAGPGAQPRQAEDLSRRPRRVATGRKLVKLEII